MANETSAGRRRDLFWFHSILVLGGIGSLYVWFVGPMLNPRNQDGWVETPCQIESSQLKEPLGATNAIRMVEVVYRYSFEGHEHRFSHTNSLGAFPSERKTRIAARRQFPRDRKTVCYVNPKNPVEAVLERQLTSRGSNDWSALIPLGVVIIGLVGVFRYPCDPAAGRSALARRGRSTQQRGALSKDAVPADTIPGRLGGTPHSLEFKSARPPWERLAIMIFSALFVNGALAVFALAFANGDLPARAMDRFYMVVLLIVLGFIGFLLLGYCVYCFLALFNPRPWFKVNARTFAPGETLEVEWRIIGRVERLRRLRFFLEGMEAATPGVDDKTEWQILDRVTVMETNRFDQIRSGRASLVIPARLIPSFESPHNQVEWSIRIRGEIPHWPDIQEGMPVILLSAGPESADLAAPPKLSTAHE